MILINPYAMATGAGGGGSSGWSTTDRIVKINSVHVYTLSNTKLQVTPTTVAGAFNGTNRGAVSQASGKHYFEVTIGGTLTGTEIAVGVMGNGTIPATGDWKVCTDQVCYRPNGQIFRNGLTFVSNGTGYSNGDVIGVAVDLGAATVSFYINNTLRDTVALSATTPFPTFWVEDAAPSPSGTLITASAGQVYAPPTGFTPWE